MAQIKRKKGKATSARQGLVPPRFWRAEAPLADVDRRPQAQWLALRLAGPPSLPHTVDLAARILEKSLPRLDVRLALLGLDLTPI